MNIAAETQDYHQRLDWYISQKRLPVKWFTNPQYLTLETPDIAEFQDLVERPKKERVIRVPEEDDRFVVAAKLAGAFQIGSLGRIRWVKIEESSEQKRPDAPINLKEVDFFVRDFSQAVYFLGARGLEHELIEQEDYYQIGVEFDNEGNRFCLLSMPIEVIVDEMLFDHRAHELDQAA
jgi:hypothetical protein